MSHPNPPNTRIQKGKQSPRRTLRALLDFTFLRYCIVGALASGVFYCVANLSALLLKVDSRSSYFASAECVDSKEAALRLLCHAANAARNDDKGAMSKKMDSRSEAQSLESTFENAQNAGKSAQDSRILELQIGVFQGSQGDKTSGLSTLQADEIHDFSPKAESSKEARHSQTATLLGSLASFLFGYFAQMRLAFRANPNHSTMLPRYLALLALIAIYAQAIAYLGAFFTLSYYLVSAFIALSVPLFSYPLQKLWVFAGTSKGGGGGQLRRVGFAPKHTQSLDSISTILESLFLLSLRALRGKAWQSPLCHCEPMKSAWQSIKSTINPRIHFYKKSTSALFSTFFSPFLWLFGLTPRPSIRPLLFAPCSNFSKTNTLFTTTETMDCHADKSARNDRNNATSKKVDSRSKAQPTHHDSKHCSGAVVALRDFGGRARLEVCGCPKNRAINRIAYPRLNRSRILQKHLIPFFKESL